MIVRITSCAPVRALRAPTSQPMTTPPASAPSTHTTTWMTAGMLYAKPSQAATIEPPMNWLCAPMLNRHTRNAIPTERPVRISGVAANTVSDSG